MNNDKTDLFNAGFDEHTIEVLIDAGYTLESTPQVLKDYKDNEEKLEEYLKIVELFAFWFDNIEVQTYLDNNFDLEDIECLLDDGIYYSDIPEFLTNKKETDYNTIKEWIDIASEFDEYIAESAYNLDITPDNVAESYKGECRTGGDFAENLVNDCYCLDSTDLPSFITNHIDYQAIWDCELRDYYKEDNGYYFQIL